VIEEDHPQPETAKKIEPQVALDPMRESRRILVAMVLIHIVLSDVASIQLDGVHKFENGQTS
jgi:hypothetical protein